MNTDRIDKIILSLLASLFLLVPVRATSADSYVDSDIKQSPLNNSYELNRNLLPTSKPLMLIFEKTGCTDCEEFRNDVLRQQQMKNALKQFEVVRLDATNNKTIIITPDGNCTTSATLFRWYAFNRMPAIAIFDVDGHAVLKTDSHLLPRRMMNFLNFVLEKAYEKGWTYKQFANTKSDDKAVMKSE